MEHNFEIPQHSVYIFKGYSSVQSHFLEINAKLAEENKFVTHFVQKCLETHENEQNVVLNESSEMLGNHLKIVQILVLAMTTADDVWAEVILSEKLLLVFRCFTNKMVLFAAKPATIKTTLSQGL